MPTHYQGTDQEQLALDTFIKLTRAASSFMDRLIVHNTFEELTPSQFAVMEALLHLGPLSQSEIANKILRSEGNITLVIDNLEKHSLVQRTRSHEDRRVVIVSLTARGEQTIGRIFPRHLAAIVEEISVLSAEEQALLGRLCRKLGKREQTDGSN
jgi:MarR family 2-MHQ and catechol resistance regulon transcriptional repressor